MSGNAFSNNNFYESERHSTILSHDDFCKDADFEFLEQEDALIDFLLSRHDWDVRFVTNKSNLTKVDNRVANMVFEQCFEKFKHSMDTVQIFSAIVDFYALEPKYYYDKLVATHRTILIRDLQQRLGKVQSETAQTFSNDKVQKTFSMLFEK